MAKTSLFGKTHSGGPVVIEDEGQTTGARFFVDSGSSTNGATSGYGDNPDKPLSTIDAAIALCTASNGDIIYVMPGHTETIAAASGIDVDVAGVTIIGLGHGADRPTITLSATGSTFEMAAASGWIENLLFTTSAAATIIVDVNAADCTIKNCEFRMLTAVTAIDVDGGSANACDRTQILDCVFDGSTDGPDEAIHLNEVADSVTIDGCYAYGLFDDAAIHNPTGSVLTWLRITNNILINTTAASHSIELVSASTGLIGGNTCGSPLADATAVDIDGGGTHMVENYSVDASGNVSGLINPVVVS